MNTMDFNQKIDVSLRASLEATPVERNASDDLSTGSSSDGFWNLIVLYTGSPQTLQNEFPSSSFTFLLGNYAIVKISEDDIPSLAAFPQVIYIERPRQLFFEIVSARQASCLSAIQENSSYGLTGKGILISVIDSGIDYAHPDFCNPDKTTRLVALWDQTILADPSAGRFAPAGYSQGTLFSPEQINAALQADTFEQRMELVPSIVPVDVFHHISLLHMKRLVGDGVHGLLGSPAFQHRPGKHDLPGSSAVVAQPVLVERLDRDLCPVRHPQHGKLIGGQLLCQFGLAVQRRRFPGILRKAGQEFLFVKLCRRFCLPASAGDYPRWECRPAAPHAQPAGTASMTDRWIRDSFIILCRKKFLQDPAHLPNEQPVPQYHSTLNNYIPALFFE